LATSTFTLSCDASSASPNPVAPGGTATLQASATSSQTYTDANILFDVFDSTGTRVYYISRHNVDFTGGVVQTFMGTWSVPSTQAAGPYTLKFGVFTATWSTLYAYKTCTTFSVASGATGTSANTPVATATLAPAATTPATATLAPAATTPATTGTTASPGGATFSNSFDDQSTGVMVTGPGADQFSGTSGFTSLRVQNTA